MKRLLVILFVVAGIFSTFTAQAQDDSLFTRRSEQPKKKFSWEKITVGGNFSLSLGNPLSIYLSPLIGYRITEKFTAGAGPSYVYYRTKDRRTNTSYSSTVLGGRAFAQHILFDNLAARGEYEYVSIKHPVGFTNLGDVIEQRDWISNPLLGLSYSLPIGRRSAFNITVLYNFNYKNRLNQQYLYGGYGENNPFVIRVGGMF